MDSGLSIADAEAWARENIHWLSRSLGHRGMEWIAQIRVDGLVFEGRAGGEIRKRDATRARAADAAVRDYVGFIGRVGDE